MERFFVGPFFAAGFTLRVTITLLMLAATASAGTITAINIPGLYEITGVNWDNGVNVVGVNQTTGLNFALTGSGANYFEYATHPSLLTYGRGGVANGYVIGGGLNDSFAATGTAYSLSTGSWQFYGDYLPFAVGTNGQVGGSVAGQNGFVANVGGEGTLANIQIIAPPSGTTSLAIDFVRGDVSGGVAGSSTPDTTYAFIADDGVRRSIATGGSSAARGFDPTTNSGFGFIDGYAVEWLPDGTLLYFNNPDGSGRLRGEVTSGFGGLRVIKATDGSLYVTNGTTVMTFGQYIIALGIAAPLMNPDRAWFVGDSLEMAFVFPGSIRLALGETATFHRPFGLGNEENPGGEVPEPGTWAMMIAGLALLFLFKKQRGTSVAGIRLLR